MSKERGTARPFQINTMPYTHIRIVSHPKKVRKSRKHMTAVRAITFAAALMSIYGLMLLEFHPVAGIIIFGISFTYLMLFAYANGRI